MPYDLHQLLNDLRRARLRFQKAENDFYLALSNTFEGMLRARGLTPEEAEDQNERLQKLGQLLVDGQAAPGKENAWLRRCACNAAIDAARLRRRLGPVLEPLVEDCPSEDAAEIEEQETRDALLAQLQEVLEDPDLPERYKTVLIQVYLEEQPIADLARKELQDHPQNPKGNPRTEKQARNTVDSLLRKARKWVQQRIAKLIKERSN